MLVGGAAQSLGDHHRRPEHVVVLLGHVTDGQPDPEPEPRHLACAEAEQRLLDATAAVTASAALPKEARQPSPIVLTSTPSAAPMAVENMANSARLASSARSTPSRRNSSVEPTTSAISTVTVRLRDTP